MQNQDLLVEFLTEATSQVNTVEDGLLSLERGEEKPDTIHEIFRALHSIKGTAGFFALSNIVDLAHAMENLFGEIRKGRMTITVEAIDILLEGNDLLKQMVGDVDNSNKIDISLLLERINRLYMGEGVENSQFVQIPGETTLKNPEEFFSAARKRGLKIFYIYIHVDRSTSSEDETPPPELIENINSIGKLFSSTKIINEDGAPAEAVTWRFLITTVLEKSLLTVAFDLPEDSFVEITCSSQLAIIQDTDKEKEGEDKDIDLEAYSREENNLPGHSENDLYLEERGSLMNGFSPAERGRGVDEAGVVEVEDYSSPLYPKDEAGRQYSATDLEQIQGKAPPSNDDSVRVNVSLLNDLLNLASEMVLGRNQLLRLLFASRKTIPGLNTVLQNIDSITSELQEKIMLTRMQPMARVFNKFPRIVRELSKKVGKNVNLSIKGQEVELDKSIVEGLSDPLTHLVRNCIDHGLELPTRREELGKPAAGTISLHAYHEGGHVIIDVMDDGAGIDLEKIKAKAVESKHITPENIALMGEQEIYALLFRAGFSMATRVTDLSGRGVGLDVVRTNVEKMGGVLEVMTVLGLGTTFRLTMPLTLAIIPSLIVEVCGQKFALPQVNLQEMVRVKKSDPTKKIELIGDASVLRLRDKLLPVVHLSEVLGLNNMPSQEEDHNSRGNSQDSLLLRVLIIKSGSKRFGLIVDLIHDPEEILVKQLPSYLRDCLSYSGVTILGDGRIAMILDPEGIASKAGLRFSSENTGQLLPRQEQIHGYKEEQSLLLFKCSGPETFCMDLSMVARVEKIHVDQIEMIGDREYIQFRGESLRVLRPEDFYPVQRGQLQKKHLFVIIPKLVKYPMGILLEQIMDTHEANIQFSREEVKVKGLIGTAIIANHITLVINIYELFELAAPELYAYKTEMDFIPEKINVLLVEDTPFFLKLEKQYLESAGYKVLTSVNGRDAWELLQEEHVDIVVSDIVMPVMNGYELVKKIRADHTLADLPVIAVTSKADPESMEKGMEAGFDYYEVKLSKDLLLEKVGKALQQRKIPGLKRRLT